MNQNQSLIGQPFNIQNKLELKNRIVMAPVYIGNNIYAKEYLNFFAKRIMGGIGLLILPIPTPNGIQILSTSDFKAFSKELLTLSKEAGCKIVPQIFSGVGEKVNEYTTDEIAQIPEDLAKAAEYIKDAGYDGFEIHGAHHSLFMHLLTPLLNKRQDVYGSDRTKIQLEAVEKIRKSVGEDFPLFIRFSASDLAEGGVDLRETIPYAQALEKAGIDCLDISVGGTGASPKYSECPDKTKKKGCFAPYFEAIKKSVSVPVIGCGKIHTRLTMDNILWSNQADLVAVGRPFVPDPDFAKKILEESKISIRSYEHWYKELPEYN